MGPVAVTCSAGVSLLTALDGDETLLQAGQAMFQCKLLGQAGFLPRAEASDRPSFAAVEHHLEGAAES